MRTPIFVLGSLLASVLLFAQDAKPKLNIDEFFNSVSFSALKVSPDGKSVLFGTEKADWDQQIFRSQLWLYRVNGNGGSLIQLTQSGHDSTPQWSPDGQWIAFLSERKAGSGKAPEAMPALGGIGSAPFWSKSGIDHVQAEKAEQSEGDPVVPRGDVLCCRQTQ